MGVLHFYVFCQSFFFLQISFLKRITRPSCLAIDASLKHLTEVGISVAGAAALLLEAVSPHPNTWRRDLKV